MSLVLWTAVGLLATGGALAAWARRRWLVVTVEGNSMSPTLHHGQRLIARRLRGEGFARSDIIVFLLPPEQLEETQSLGLPLRVKRVVAIAGDPVPQWARQALGADEQTRVPPGKVVVSGDNTDRTQDSRHLGYIDARLIIAVVPSPP